MTLSSLLCILCKAWIYFSVSSSGTAVLKSDRLLRLKVLRLSLHTKKKKKKMMKRYGSSCRGWSGGGDFLLKRISSSSLSCLYFFWAKTCPFCSSKILKLKVNPTLLWAGLTTMEASDQDPGGCIQLEKVVLVSPFISTLHFFVCFYPLYGPKLRRMGGIGESPRI